MAGAVAGGLGLSQFPEFSQQYLQRLGGTVDELTRVVDDFDADAREAGLTREEALAEFTGSALMANRHETWVRTFNRHERLSEALQMLRNAGPFTRLNNAWSFTDAEIAEATWADYKPAVPATVEGVSFAVVGAVAGGLAVGAIVWLLTLPFRRRSRA